MQDLKDIGGYIEFNFGNGKTYHYNAIALNLGRNCLKYIIEVYNIKEMYVPMYTCPVIWDTIKKSNCKINFYNINDDFLPEREFSTKDYILYTNYFGVCSEKIKYLTTKYPNIIIDNAQAFYMKSLGFASFYSPRKFFGVPDGGYLYCKKKAQNFPKDKNSYSRCSPLLKRIEGGANFGYKEFNKTEKLLNKEPIMVMSNLTKSILAGIDYEQTKRKRIKNFTLLKEALDEYNEFNICITDDIPMYYPFLKKRSNLRKMLLENKIYIPCCWRGLNMNYVQLSSYELYLLQYLHPLIIDQRYDENDMKRIINIVRKAL